MEEESKKTDNDINEYIPIGMDLLHIIPSTSLLLDYFNEFKDFNIFLQVCHEWKQDIEKDPYFQRIMIFFDRIKTRARIRQNGRYCWVCKCSRSSDCTVCNICGVTTEANKKLLENAKEIQDDDDIQSEYYEHFSFFSERAPGSNKLYISSCKSFISLLKAIGVITGGDYYRWEIEDTYNSLSIDSCMFFEDYLLYQAYQKRRESMGGEILSSSLLIEEFLSNIKVAIIKAKNNNRANGLMENEIEDAYNKMDPIYMEEYGFYDSWEILSEKLLKDLLTDDRENNNNNKIYPYKTCVRIAFKLFANDNGNLCMIPAYT